MRDVRRYCVSTTLWNFPEWININFTISLLWFPTSQNLCPLPKFLYKTRWTTGREYKVSFRKGVSTIFWAGGEEHLNKEGLHSCIPDISHKHLVLWRDKQVCVCDVGVNHLFIYVYFKPRRSVVLLGDRLQDCHLLFVQEVVGIVCLF